MNPEEPVLRADFRQEESDRSAPATIRVRYEPAGTVLEDPVLASIEFGASADTETAAPLAIKVRLEALDREPMAEYWLATGPVQAGRASPVRFAHDEHYLFATIEIDEREHGGILHAAEYAYRAAREFQRTSGFPNLLRMWNFMDAVNDGDGDLERYRQFCVGRARGLADASSERYPAATAIGRQLTTHELQVFWLAGRHEGTAIENPRQVSAYRYPRTHGPASPSFSRATITKDGTLLISGTASIVGHVSQHPGEPLAQLEETLRNLRVLIERARPNLAGQDETMLLKVYVRDRAHADAIAACVRTAFPNDRMIVLAADICRRELLLEIECVLPAFGS